MLAFTIICKAQGPKKREILRVIATSEGQFYIKRRLWKIIKLHLRSHLSLSRLLHWTVFKTSLDKSRKTWNIPAEQTLFSLPHFHFCRADLSSIVTWVLWDFGGWRQRGSHGSVVHAVPRFSVTNLRVLIRNASPQSLVFTFGSQPHRKLSHRRRIPSRRRSYQTCKTKIIYFTKQHRFSGREIHYVVLTFASKFKNLHSTLTYCGPPPLPPILTDSEKMNWKESAESWIPFLLIPHWKTPTNQTDYIVNIKTHMRVHVDFVLLCVKHHFQFHGWTEGSVQQRRLSPDTKDGEHYDERGLNDNTQPFKSRFL